MAWLTSLALVIIAVCEALELFDVDELDVITLPCPQLDQSEHPELRERAADCFDGQTEEIADV